MEYTYDTMNRLTAEVSGNARVQYHYDRKGNRTRQEHFHEERIVNGSQEEGQTESKIRCPIKNFLKYPTKSGEKPQTECLSKYWVKSSAKGKGESQTESYLLAQVITYDYNERNQLI
ncbi:MAG: hypothetical protein IKL51_06635 [Lachnospiraceae bacterium]|nr:hypothetical protein [Lachnospiraceae bacterium]